MVNFLFFLCINPLESAMRTVLECAYSLTGSWGVSLVLMSLAVNIALIPVYHLAETWQEAERAIQKKMAPKLAEIKDVFSGKERYMYMRALYRLHGYSPIYALRTSFGLLIQIPFFFAAYHLLNAAPELAGASWLFISDLSKPDALLPLGSFSINLLPFVMTAANLVSAAVYTSRLTRREKIQLYGLAALFLILLYPSSSALLVYWTCNNLFSLGKNLVYTNFVYTDAAHHPISGSEKPDILPPAPLTGAFRWADIILALLGGAVFAFSIVLRKRTGVSPQVLTIAASATFLTFSALAYRIYALKRGIDMRENGLARYYGLFPAVIGVVVAISVWKLTSFKKLNDPASWAFFRLYACSIGLLVGWVFSREPLQPLFRKLAAFAGRRLDAKNAAALFTASAITMGVLICWYIPATLYASDSNFFYEPFDSLLGRLTFRGLAFLAVCGVIYKFAHPRIKPLFAVAWAWTAMAALLFTFVAVGDYGTMDEFMLQNPAPLKTRLAFLVDIAVSSAAGGIIYLAFRRASKGGFKHMTVLLQGTAFALCLISAYHAVVTPPNEHTTLENALSPRLPDYNDELLGFSRDGTNTVVIMLDMFTGSHMDLILKADPGMRQGLDGFVWYSDTVAPGATTLLTIGSLLGGENYTPPAINARKPDSLKNELHRAFGTLPGIFSPKGYAVALADVDELVPATFEKICPAAKQSLVVGKSMTTAYTGYWRVKNNRPSATRESRAPFMASVGLFRAAPWAIRAHIYYDGSWLNTQTVIHNPSEGPYAMLDLLPEVANAKHGGNTLKYITSQVAHYPWRLDEATCMPIERTSDNYTVEKNGVIREHVGNELCGLKALVRWFDWMKKEGVYDNTLIILVSDHDGNDSAVFGKEFNDLRPPDKPWKPDALLLVKQRNSRGDLVVDTREMSSADVVPLICAAEGVCPEGEFPNPLEYREKPRTRTHSAGLASVRRHDNDRFITEDFTITGNSHDRANWHKTEAR